MNMSMIVTSKCCRSPVLNNWFWVDVMECLLLFRHRDKGQWLDITALRDIQGEKRIFYYDSPRVLILASTPSFILKVMEEFDEPVTLNEVALKDYFVTRTLYLKLHCNQWDLSSAPRW